MYISLLFSNNVQPNPVLDRLVISLCGMSVALRNSFFCNNNYAQDVTTTQLQITSWANGQIDYLSGIH